MCIRFVYDSDDHIFHAKHQSAAHRALVFGGAEVRGCGGDERRRDVGEELTWCRGARSSLDLKAADALRDRGHLVFHSRCRWWSEAGQQRWTVLALETRGRLRPVSCMHACVDLARPRRQNLAELRAPPAWHSQTRAACKPYAAARRELGRWRRRKQLPGPAPV